MLQWRYRLHHPVVEHPQLQCGPIRYLRYTHTHTHTHTQFSNASCCLSGQELYRTITDPSHLFPLIRSDPSVLAGSWTGHTDAVWGLAYSGIKNRLLSCSADGTVKLWNPTEKNPCISTFNANKGEDRRRRAPPGGHGRDGIMGDLLI